MKKEESIQLTDTDIELMREYLKELDEITQRKPEPVQDDIWDKVIHEINTSGQVPAEYRDVIGVVEEIPEPNEKDKTIRHVRFYDVKGERWNSELAQLNVKYRDIIIKILRNNLNSEFVSSHSQFVSVQIEDIIKKLLPKDKVNPRSKAIEKGALMSLNGNVAAYSDDELKNSLNGFSIFRLPSNIDAENVFDQSGKLNLLSMQQAELEELDRLQSGFLFAVVQAVDLYQDSEKATVTFYLPSICQELHIDPRTYSTKRQKNGENNMSYSEIRLNAILSILRPFDPLVGRTPDGSYYRLLTFESYDKESDSITVITPYLYKLKEITSGKTRQLHKLLHSDVANEPNTAAVELANRILIGIVNRGVRNPDGKEQKVTKKTTTKTNSTGQKTTTTLFYNADEEQAALQKNFTYSVKYSTLINECPQLKKELEDIEERGSKNYKGVKPPIKRPAQAYNKKLQDVFTAAFRIIAEKSDAPTRYLEFSLPKTQRTVNGVKTTCYDVPTKSTISRKMIITYKGKNPRFID